MEPVITFREAECDDLTDFPVMVVADPTTGERRDVTVESVIALSPESDDK